LSEPIRSTSYLGQYTDEHAEVIAAQLEEAGIYWWHKKSGRLVRTLFAGDWGVRLFVDETKLEQAREIAKKVTG
jgi:hypothetical protein